MVDLSVKVGGLTLANPVMPASGTFAHGNARVFDLNCLVIEAIEAAVARPVITSNAALLWYCLKKLNIAAKSPGYGVLLNA